MDLGCYSLHAHRGLAPWAGGLPRLVTARGGERAGRPGVDEWLTADLEFQAELRESHGATWPGMSGE
jgi:hypothetical protein